MRTKFSNKCKTANTIFLVEDEKVFEVKKAIANTFNNYFTDVTYFLGLKKNNIGLENTLSKIMKTFRNFESIKKVKAYQQGAENSAFSTKIISEKKAKNAINDLPINNLIFLLIFEPKFLSSILRSTPRNWQIFLMNL